MAITYYMDVHIPAAVTTGLRRRGVDVLTSQEDGTREAGQVHALHAEYRRRCPVILIRRNMWTRDDLYRVIIILGYVNLVPYLSRVYRGLAWAAQYSPEGGFFSWIVIHSFPAVPVIIAYRLRRILPVTFIVSIIVVTAHLSYWHHDLELPRDPLAAGFTVLMMSIRTFMYTTLVTAITLVAELVTKFFIRVTRKFLGGKRDRARTVAAGEVRDRL